VSMGHEAERQARLDALTAYRVSRDHFSHAPEAVVVHCLPATRGEGITADVLDGDRSVVRQQAEPRLPMQQALLDRVCRTRVRRGDTVEPSTRAVARTRWTRSRYRPHRY
jgi:ornithine carbamoyltransferase